MKEKSQIVSEYDQKLPQPQTADKPTVSRGSATKIVSKYDQELPQSQA